MRNEVLLLVNLVVVYASVLLFYKYLGKTGLYVWTALATVTANIEVLILVDAFGMEQTLGNMLFASTFLATDILSERYGKKEANLAVKVGVGTSIMFVILSQFWMQFTPSASDWVSPAIADVFTAVPRVMVASILVYAISQVLDVWLYHYLWEKTKEKTQSTKAGLWVRNNGSTMLSQLVNVVLFNVLAFGGDMPMSVLLSVIGAGYLVFIVTSLLDTPVVYLARKMKVSGE